MTHKKGMCVMYNLRNDLPLLFDFYRVAKYKNISKAAENYISGPNLSRNIKTLESRLNLCLFTRDNKGMKLTLDGERLFEKIKNQFESIDIYETNELTENYVGKLVVGTTRNIADNKLSKYLVKFHEKYPNIHIYVITDIAPNLNQYLLEHKIDVLIDYLPNINFSQKNDVIIKPFSKFKTCFACSNSFYNIHKDDLKKLADLKKYSLVIPGSSRRRQMLDEVLQANSIQLQPTVEMPDSLLMVDFVNNTDSIGYFVEEELKNSNLKILDLVEELPENVIGIIYYDNIGKEAQYFVQSILGE